MLILGVILALLGWFLAISWLVTLGVIVAVVGLILLLLGAANHPVGGRRYWY